MAKFQKQLRLIFINNLLSDQISQLSLSSLLSNDYRLIMAAIYQEYQGLYKNFDIGFPWCLGGGERLTID